MKKGKSKSPAAPAPDKAVAAGATQIDRKLVRQLADVLNETGLTEIEYDSGGVRIRVARHATHAAVGAAPAAFYAPTASAEAPPPPPAKPLDPASHPGTVKSPMVGVAYLLPEPGAAPFIKVGDQVTEGQTLALIEAMKTFNPVKAPRAGKVVQILFETGSPVEYGEPLVVIE